MKHLKIHPLLPVAVLFSYLSGSLYLFFATYLSLLFHECVHLFFLCKNKILLRRIVLEPFGVCIETENQPPDSLTVYLSAPISNLLIAGLIWLIYQYRPFPHASDWFFSNLCLGCCNLIPCLPLDGGRALELILKKKYGESDAKKKMGLVSLSLSSAIIASGLWLLWYTKYQISLIIIGIFLLYCSLCRNKLTLYHHLSETAIRQTNGFSDQSRKVCYLSAPWDLPARKLISDFRGDSYYVIHVIKNGEIIKTVTETRILNKLLHCDGTIKLCEC